MEIPAWTQAEPRNTFSEQKSPSVAFHQQQLSLSTQAKDTYLAACSQPYFPNPLRSPNSCLASDMSLVILSPNSNVA